MSGVVVLSWTSVQRDAASAAGDSSVVLHEMAHILDAEDGIFDGQPLLDGPSQGAEWAATLQREFPRQQRAVESGNNPPLDEYAATNYAELFAVATESFFCTPRRLRKRLPELYVQMRRFFRQDPADSSSKGDAG